MSRFSQCFIYICCVLTVILINFVIARIGGEAAFPIRETKSFPPTFVQSGLSVTAGDSPSAVERHEQTNVEKIDKYLTNKHA